jgi:hypothetical protein
MSVQQHQFHIKARAATAEFEDMKAMMEDVAHNNQSHFHAQDSVHRTGQPRIQFKAFKRHVYDFPFGSVTLTWGPLRQKNRELKTMARTGQS